MFTADLKENLDPPPTFERQISLSEASTCPSMDPYEVPLISPFEITETPNSPITNVLEFSKNFGIPRPKDSTHLFKEIKNGQNFDYVTRNVKLAHVLITLETLIEAVNVRDECSVKARCVTLGPATSSLLLRRILGKRCSTTTF